MIYSGHKVFSYITFNVVMLSVVVLSLLALNVVMLSVVVLSVLALNVVTYSVIILGVVAPYFRARVLLEAEQKPPADAYCSPSSGLYYKRFRSVSYDRNLRS